MTAVPNVLDRVRTAVTGKIDKSGAIAKTLFQLAYYYKSRAVENDGASHFWDWALMDRYV